MSRSPATLSGESEQPASGSSRQVGRRHAWSWIVATLLGLAVRILLLTISPKYGYLYDHDDFVRWGIQATDEGLTTLYDRPPPRWNLRRWSEDKWISKPRTLDRVCNYPPMATYLLWGSGLVFKAVSDDRLINTVTSRAIFCAWSIIADILLAWGCAALVARYRPGVLPHWTYWLALLIPPFWWDSAVWGQMDAVVLAPVVWMVWALAGHRWMVAGLLYGAAAALKPHAVLFLPVWALAIVIARPFWKPLAALAIAPVVVLLSSLPFTLSGGWDWLRLSYLENLLQAYAVTTLKAFNVWYVDLLLSDSADATVRWLGMAKDTWGKAFLFAGLAGGFAWMVWRWRRDSRALALWSGLTLLMFVMLPTRVHERYLVLPLPFLMVVAMLWRRFWLGLLMLIIVATAQLAWPLWLAEPAGNWASFERKQATSYEKRLASVPPQHRHGVPSLEEYLEPARQEYLGRRSQVVRYEWMFTILALAGSLAVVVAAVSLRPANDALSPLCGTGPESREKTTREGGRRGRRR